MSEDIYGTKNIGNTPDVSTKQARSLAKNGIRRTIRRTELQQIVPLAATTIYEMEQRGEFPCRFNLSPRCVVWDLAEVESWIEERRRISYSGALKRSPAPNVRLRVKRPVRQES